ncbi:MAG: arylsulfotransferase family protein [Pseudomonadota bacterium]|nr:arylsulfotransferase family protein [Pseudomonadota bacterium]
MNTSEQVILDRICYLLLIISIAFLAFVTGAIVVLAKVFPYEYFNKAYVGAVALYDQATHYESPFNTNLWRRSRTSQCGVTRYDSGRAYNGLTLYTSRHAQKAFLISMHGEVVHKWELPIREIWEDPAHSPRPEGYVTWDFVHMFPNGDLLAIYVGHGDTPWGYGLVRMDKNSKVIWKYFDHVHHQVDVAADGKIYALTNDIQKHRVEGYEHLEPPRIDDYVVVLSPDGKQIKKVSVLNALLRSRYGRMMRTLSWDIRHDFLHTNSVDVIEGTAASKLAFASEGQVLLSLRNINAVAVLDLEREKVVWALHGPWRRQHDADLLPNGNILLFDNGGHFQAGGGSRVLEFSPLPLKMVWNYAGDNEHLFESRIRSGQQRLPNGNTLITESDGGRLIEVTRTGDIVWEYVNPVRGGETEELIPVLSEGVRLDPASLEPNFVKFLKVTSPNVRAIADGACVKHRL